jgi:putative peptidoglycan lipid II flippase
VFAPLQGWSKMTVQIIAANVALIGFLLWLNPDVSAWLEFDVWHRLGWLLGLVFGSIVVYVVALIAVGVNPKRLLRS